MSPPRRRENGLSKRIDINKYCAPTGTGSKQTTGVPTDCGFAKNYSLPEGDLVTDIDFSTALLLTDISTPVYWYDEGWSPSTNLENYSFQMSNGYSVMLFYNYKCAQHRDNWITLGESDNYSPRFVCMSGIYDMNGKKGPNQAGRDLGFFSVNGAGLTSIASVALPLTEFGVYKDGAKSGSGSTFAEAMTFCDKNNSKIPTIEELGTMSMADKLVLPTEVLEYFFISGTQYNSNRLWGMALGGDCAGCGGYTDSVSISSPWMLRCIRK